MPIMAMDVNIVNELHKVAYVSDLIILCWSFELYHKSIEKYTPVYIIIKSLRFM